MGKVEFLFGRKLTAFLTFFQLKGQNIGIPNDYLARPSRTQTCIMLQAIDTD